jgi:hypothetical protein
MIGAAPGFSCRMQGQTIQVCNRPADYAENLVKGRRRTDPDPMAKILVADIPASGRKVIAHQLAVREHALLGGRHLFWCGPILDE